MIRRATAFGFALAAPLLAGALVPSPAPVSAQMASGKEKFLGNIVADDVPADFGTYWNQITPENSTKWESVEGTRDRMDWATADAAYDYTRQHGYRFKFHTLVWGSQYPRWITDSGLTPEQQRAEVEEWMRLAGERYPNTWAVDVVNEPLNAPAPFRAALGGEGATGWDWVITSFQLARKYFPGAVLLLNEFGTENDADARRRYKDIIDILKARGLIDGVGIQAHYFDTDRMNAGSVTLMLDDYATLGLDLYISELDITGGGDESVQRDKYADVFPAMWNHDSVKGITFWGYLWGRTWRRNTGLVGADGTERAAMVWLKRFLEDPATPPLP